MWIGPKYICIKMVLNSIQVIDISQDDDDAEADAAEEAAVEASILEQGKLLYNIWMWIGR